MRPQIEQYCAVLANRCGHARLRIVASIFALAAVMAPTPALAAGAVSYSQVLLVSAVASLVVLLLWAAYYFGGLHRHVVRHDAAYKRAILPWLGALFIVWALVSIALGHSSLGQGAVVIRDIEPQRFWQQVMLKFGAGCLLIVVGLSYPQRR